MRFFLFLTGALASSPSRQSSEIARNRPVLGNDDDAERFFQISAALAFDPQNHNDTTLEVGDDANFVHDFYNTSDWVTSPDGGNRFVSRMNVQAIISSAHRQIRAAHKTDEMSTALRMTEDFSEQQFADIAKEYEAQEARVRKLKEKLRNVLRIEIDIIESQL